MSQHYRSILQLSGGVAPFTNTYSMSFDGVDESFIVGNSTSLNITSSQTFSMWFKTTSSAVMYPITQGSGSEIKYFIQLYAPIDRIRLQIYDGSSVVTIVDNTQVFDDGNWHHLAFTTDALTTTDGIKVYFDGNLLTNKGTLSNSGIRSITTALYIGQIPNTARFNGNIDEVAIFNSELSASDVTAIYNSGVPTSLSSYPSLVSWWRMGDGDTWGGSSWTLTDNGSGGNDATSVNMEEADRLPISPNSYSQNSFSFDGVDEYFDLGDLSSVLSSKTSASVSLWFKRDTLTNQILLDLKDGTSRIAIQLYQNTAIYFYLNNKYYSHPTVPAIDTWYNLIYVFNGNGATNQDKLKMYLNGIELTGGTYSGAIDTAIGTLTSSMTSNIGRTPSIAYFNGNIDEFYIWDNDQSSNISTIFNNGVPTDISSLSPISHWRMGESATWNGSTWTLTDQGSGGNDATSVNMEEADKTGDQAYVL